MLGAGFAPGNLISLATGHKKTALGLTLAGSLIGAGVGAQLGYKNGISKWEHDNDPKREEKDKELYKKALKASKEEATILSKEINYVEWTKLSEKNGRTIPKEILDYINFYEKTWKNKINQWYSTMPDTGNPLDIVVDFIRIFPIPVNPKEIEDWDDKILFLTCDWTDVWVCYDFNSKKYGWYPSCNEPSLKNLLCKHVDKVLKNGSKYLSGEQIKLAQEFKRNLR